jgi:ribosomal-protein-alanine N-acetyltransferase
LDDIETTRLILRRFEPEALQAGLSGNLAVLEQCLGATVPTDLAEDPAVPNYAQAAADPAYLAWSVRALIVKSTMQMVGHVRFHSRPDPNYLRPHAPNAVEFG